MINIKNSLLLQCFLVQLSYIKERSVSMGAFTKAMVAYELYVEKKKEYGYEEFTKQEILTKLEKSLDLSLYEIREDDEVVLLKLKPDILKQNGKAFFLEQIKLYEGNSELLENTENFFDQMGEKTIIEAIKEYKPYMSIGIFDYGMWGVTYLDRELNIYWNGIFFLYEGKVIMECYVELSRYLHNLIRKTSQNPLRNAVVIDFQ